MDLLIFLLEEFVVDVTMDCIDNNYVWQRRVLRAFRNCKTPVPFPAAVELGVEFNPAFERQEKIDVTRLTNGAIMDLSDFAKTVTKAEMYFFFEILDFNFDLGFALESSQCYNFVNRIHATAKNLREQSKTRPLQFHSKLNDVFPLPETVSGETSTDPKRVNFKHLLSSESTQSSAIQQTNTAKGSPVFIKKFYGRTVQLTMDDYPLCKKHGFAVVLRPENAPAQKFNTGVLTIGVVLEMLNFAKFLRGSYLPIIRELITHNFGDVYDPVYLNMQISKLSEKKLTLATSELREAYRNEPFQFMIRAARRKIEKKTAPEVEAEESLPQKRRSTVNHLNTDFLWEDTEMSYMCPVEFESDLPTHPETANVKSEDGLVDVETVFPEPVMLRQKKEEEYIPILPPNRNALYLRRPRKTGELSVSELFSEDVDLEICRKTVKQKEWIRRSERIKELLNKSGKVSDLFYRCREIGVDFNVGSGRRQSLDLNLLTNHTMYEVNRFAVNLSRSLSAFLSNIMENNFNLSFHDEIHERNFFFYLIMKEKSVVNQLNNEKFLSTSIPFPEGYNMVDVTGDFQSEEEKNLDPSAKLVTDSTDAEFPYCERIGLNLWSLEERPPGKKLDLSVLTYGALFEILSFGRRLCSKARDLIHDVLEHNFDLDLEDCSTEEFQAINRWFSTQKVMIKKVFSTIKGNAWLNEVVNMRNVAMVTKLKNKAPDLKADSAGLTPKKVECTYDICRRIGLDLNVSFKSEAKQKLDFQLLTRGALFEVHHYIKSKCSRYIPALYEILEYNFDLSSQKHCKVEFAWSIASQVLNMVRKCDQRKGDYMNQVFEMPFEFPESSESCCKEEPEDGCSEMDPDNDDILFVQKLIPVDIEVEID